MTQDQREILFPEIGAGEGLSWSWHLDLETLLAALSEPAPWNRCPPSPVPHPSGPAVRPGSDLIGPNLKMAGPSLDLAGRGPGRDLAGPGPDLAGPAESADREPVGTTPTTASVDPAEADFAEYLDAVDAGRSSVVPLAVAAGRVAEVLPTSPDLAAWLACNPAGNLEDGALAGAAAGYRRLAAWAQAGELAVVAQMASRSAACDKTTEVDGDGRPGKVPADAYGQVSLALTMSQAGAEWWTNLAVDLQWRLAATGQALRDGTIDLARARAIAEATGPLDDAKARAVEDRVLPRAGEQTTGQLRASLRRAVITADPEGAERRRRQAERQAKVVLYPDAEGTASLSGQKLPGIRAAAAYARITALARALKAAGSGGGIDLLRSKVLIGLLLGTLPYIPPPPDGPPDTDSPPDPGGPAPTDSPPGTSGRPDDGRRPPGGRPDDGRPDDGGPAGPDSPPGGRSDDDGRPGTGGLPDSGPAGGQPAGPGGDSSPHLDDWPWNNDPAPGTSSPGDEGSTGGRCCGQESGDNTTGRSPGPDPDPPDPDPPDPDPPDPDPPEPDPPEPDPPEPDPPDPDAPLDAGSQPDGKRHRAGDQDPAGENPEPVPVPWPDATPFLPPGPAALKNLQPAGSGFLDLRLHWLTLTRGGPEPGYLTRLGPITPAQASYLAHLAAADPAAQWQAVITGPDGQLIAVTRIRTRRTPAGPAPASPRTPSSLVRRVTVIISTDQLSTATPNNAHCPDANLAKVTAAITTAARQAADRAAGPMAADTAAGGCAHTQASPAYQVPARIREYINLRDLTCRFPTCRQPAQHCDADHTKPYDQGGPTCLCNLGCLCRYHHKLKQHPQWHLDQPTPGTFTWTTPTGRTYNVQPDPQAA